MTFTAFIAAITGRRIAEHATAPSPADPDEVTDLRRQLAASQAEVRRLLDQRAEDRKAARDADEEIVRLRAANLRLADRLEQHEQPARFGPTAAVAG